MNIIGKWKISEMMTMTDNGFEFKTPEEILASCDEDEVRSYKQIFDCFTNYNEDGSIETLYPVPEGVTEEEIEEAKKEGEPFTDDNKFVIVESKEPDEGWKEVDGVLMQNNGIEGTIGDEAVDPWEKIEIIDEDNFKFALCKFTRIK